MLDGELLVVRDGVVAPFNDLQQRLNRKTVTTKMLRDYPAFVRFYDLLIDGDEDVRPLPFAERRSRLEAWHARHHPRLTDVSALVPFDDFAQLDELWSGTREAGIEGLMLKRKSSPYVSGRPKGHWWKWKRAALTLDCVLMYAQRGSGKRSSYYSDYTFGVWRETTGEDGEAVRELVPVGKAYSGFTDEELMRLDRFVRNAHDASSSGPCAPSSRRWCWRSPSTPCSRRAATSPASPCASRAFTASAGTSRPPRPTRSKRCRSWSSPRSQPRPSPPRCSVSRNKASEHTVVGPTLHLWAYDVERPHFRL